VYASLKNQNSSKIYKQPEVIFDPPPKQTFNAEKFDVFNLCLVLSLCPEAIRKPIDKFPTRIFAYLALSRLIVDILPRRPKLVSKKYMATMSAMLRRTDGA
jgi:hypothetical protein